MLSAFSMPDTIATHMAPALKDFWKIFQFDATDPEDQQLDNFGRFFDARCP
jgi:hypothetical protein